MSERGERIKEAAQAWMAYINDSEAPGTGARERQTFIDAVLDEARSVAARFGWSVKLDYDGLTSAYFDLCPGDDSDAEIVTVRISNHPGTSDISFEPQDAAETHERQIVEIAEAIAESIKASE